MNKFIIIILSSICICSCEQAVNTVSLNNNFKSAIPEAVLTPVDQCWKTSASTQEHSTEIAKARFEKDGSFTFIYKEVEITGSVEFTKNKAGRNIFITHAKKISPQNSGSSINKIDSKELATKYSNTYLWERISFRDMPSEDFLLLVDLDAHPEAAAATKGCINKNWVSKFKIAAK